MRKRELFVLVVNLGSAQPWDSNIHETAHATA